MQAPTSSYVKSSATRVEQYKEMEDCMSEFGDAAELDVQAEILCGDFNTDPRSPIDDACLKRYKKAPFLVVVIILAKYSRTSAIHWLTASSAPASKPSLLASRRCKRLPA
jgi:endonuclease/exonuclease/phosphatase family metal-dependent hydrolase